MFDDIHKPGATIGAQWRDTICWDSNPDDNSNDGKEIRIKYLTTKFRDKNEMDEIKVEKQLF